MASLRSEDARSLTQRKASIRQGHRVVLDRSATTSRSARETTMLCSSTSTDRASSGQRGLEDNADRVSAAQSRCRRVATRKTLSIRPVPRGLSSRTCKQLWTTCAAAIRAPRKDLRRADRHSTSLSAAFSWPPIPATSCSTRPAALARRPTSPSSGAGAGSRSTRLASRWRSPARASWARATRSTCSPTAPEGQAKEGEVTGKAPSDAADHGDVRQGFVYERVPHITLKSIANNAEIDVIWEKWQAKLEPLRAKLNAALKKTWEEWEIPRDADAKWSPRRRRPRRVVGGADRAARRRSTPRSRRRPSSSTSTTSPTRTRSASAWRGRSRSRACSPHRVLAVDENDNLIDPLDPPGTPVGERQGFVQMILENLKTSGVQQAHKEDRIAFTSLAPWPGEVRRAPRAATSRARKRRQEPPRRDLHRPRVRHRESRRTLSPQRARRRDAGFDVLVACAFNFDAHSSDFAKLGPSADPEGADEPRPAHGRRAKNTGKGNLFVVFGEPDIEILDAGDGGADPRPGQGRRRVRSQHRRDPHRRHRRHRRWFIDTDYNEESFFVRHAYFLGANDPYSALKTDAPSRDRRRGVGDALQRHLPPVRTSPRPAASR